MKRFRFPLRPVAVIRAHRELRAREQFAAAVHAFVVAEEELAAARVRQARLEAALFSGRSQTYRAAEAALLLADYRRDCAAEVAAERRVITARDEMQKSRAAYVEAHRQLEVVHRLEDTARLAHRRTCEREEQAEFDDRAGRSHRKPAFLSP
jgi:flagellar FliJ protein